MSDHHGVLEEAGAKDHLAPTRPVPESKGTNV